MTIKPGTKRWAELVRDGQAKDAARNWFLGDAALEIAPMSTEGGNRPGHSDSGPSGIGDLLAKYADEVGVSHDVLAKCRQISNAWPAAKRTIKTSWKAYSYLSAPDKQKLLKDGMTATQASMAAGHKNPGRIQSERDAQLAEARREAAEQAAEAARTETIARVAKGETKALLAQQAKDAEARLARQKEQDAIKAEKMAAEREAITARNVEARERTAALEATKRQEIKARTERAAAVAEAKRQTEIETRKKVREEQAKIREEVNAIAATWDDNANTPEARERKASSRELDAYGHLIKIRSDLAFAERGEWIVSDKYAATLSTLAKRAVKLVAVSVTDDEWAAFEESLGQA